MPKAAASSADKRLFRYSLKPFMQSSQKQAPPHECALTIMDQSSNWIQSAPASRSRLARWTLSSMNKGRLLQPQYHGFFRLNATIHGAMTGFPSRSRAWASTLSVPGIELIAPWNVTAPAARRP